LPKGFVRIRHFGLMANHRRTAFLDLCRKLLAMVPLVRTPVPAGARELWRCPRCKAVMRLLERLTASQLFWRLSVKALADSS